MFGASTGGKASPSLPFSATNFAGNTPPPTTTIPDGNDKKMNNGSTTVEVSKDDPDWKAKLNIPEKDHRARTSDVTNTSGHDFEDYCLKRELLMGKTKIYFYRQSKWHKFIFRYL